MLEEEPEYKYEDQQAKDDPQCLVLINATDSAVELLEETIIHRQ